MEEVRRDEVLGLQGHDDDFWLVLGRLRPGWPGFGRHVLGCPDLVSVFSLAAASAAVPGSRRIDGIELAASSWRYGVRSLSAETFRDAPARQLVSELMQAVSAEVMGAW